MKVPWESCRFEFVAAGEDDTERFGAAVARSLTAGSVVALLGDLGSGKTRLVQAVAAAWGIDRREVSSPTFTLLQEYESEAWPLYHFDAYRLEGPGEFLRLGSDELLAGNGVCFIEWADRVAAALPEDRLEIEIRTTGATSRAFTICARGRQSAAVATALRDRLRLAGA